jgi:hypothetical protein
MSIVLKHKRSQEPLFGKRLIYQNKHFFPLLGSTSAGPYLGILRPWAQENFAPPLFVRTQLCVSKNNTKNWQKTKHSVFSIDLP